MMKKVTLIFVNMGNSCPLHISVALNLKPDISVKKTFINVKNVKIVLTRKSASRGITVKPVSYTHLKHNSCTYKKHKIMFHVKHCYRNRFGKVL